MSREVIICVRQTRDWTAATPATLQYPPDVWQNPQRTMADAIRTWRQHSHRAYGRVRADMKQIAEASLAATGAQVWDITGMTAAEILARCDAYEDWVLVPTDDDDWFSPQLVAELRRLPSDVIYWRSLTYDSVRVSAIIDAGTTQWPHSNSYAISRRGFEALADATRQVHFLQNHAAFYRICNAVPLQPQFYDLPLSMWNLHMASIGYLTNCGVQRMPSPRMPSLSPATEWARPYIERFNAVLESLYVPHTAPAPA